MRTSTRHIGIAMADLLPWTGPVVRRDPASYQRPSEIRTWLCRSCRSWTMNGAYLSGRCNFCHTPRG